MIFMIFLGLNKYIKNEESALSVINNNDKENKNEKCDEIWDTLKEYSIFKNKNKIRYYWCWLFKLLQTSKH